MRTKTLHEHKLDYTKDKCLNHHQSFHTKKLHATSSLHMHVSKKKKAQF